MARGLRRCLAGLLAAVVAFSGMGMYQYVRNDKHVLDAEAKTAKIQRKTLKKKVVAEGRISGMSTYYVSADMKNAKVKEMWVKKGDRVKKGDILAIMETTKENGPVHIYKRTTMLKGSTDNGPANEQDNSLKDDGTKENTPKNNIYIEKRLADVKSKEVSAKRTMDKAKKAKDSAERELDVAGRELEDAMGALVDAEQEYVKAKSYLGEIKDTSSQDYEKAKNSVKTCGQKMTKANAIMVLKKNAYKIAKDKYNNETYTYEDAQQKHSNAESDLKVRKTSTSGVKKNCYIKAPADGIITGVYVERSSRYDGGDIFALKGDEDYKVTAKVKSANIRGVCPKMKATLAVSEKDGQEMKGEVRDVSPVEENGYPIEVSVKEPSRDMQLGAKVKVTIIEKERDDVLAVPAEYVMDDGCGNSYIKVLEDGDSEGVEKVKKIAVKKGLITDYYVEISGTGLQEGMKLTK
ncbi:MAG: HlyD family efflux transporter periplasmic adaptor subunit [Lachnospiraceae bacterium]|nr:HlyD family efflux transporter periplasmic adaptor subunit [Lachnospiraceae bacterium]